MKYRVFYQNGGYATFEWDGNPVDVEQLDDFLEAAYGAAPPGLCNQCAGNYDISDDVEVQEINEVDSGKKVFSESTWYERVHQENMAFRDKVAEMNTQLHALADALREAGFTVDRDTFAVSR